MSHGIFRISVGTNLLYARDDGLVRTDGLMLLSSVARYMYSFFRTGKSVSLRL